MEEPLPPGGSCLLSSLNLSEFVIAPFTKEARFDFNKFDYTIKHIIRAMNDVLDEGLPLHPLEEQRESVADWRQIGVGIMGLGDMLIKMNLAYGSTKSLMFCEILAHRMLNESVRASAMLAKEKGAFPKFDLAKTLQSHFFYQNIDSEVTELVKEYGLRNSQLLTIAPTGTISNLLGITGGIEPIFEKSYTRKTESLGDGDVSYKIYTPIVREYMDKFSITSEEDLPDTIVTSSMLDWHNRIEMQAVWQRYIDASISSTVNLPNSTTVEEVFNLYMYAWKMGLKGITIFRSGCSRMGILTTDEKPIDEKKGVCPECGEVLDMTGGCADCKHCGWAKCSI